MEAFGTMAGTDDEDHKMAGTDDEDHISEIVSDRCVLVCINF
jgi:hypothetical protein